MLPFIHSDLICSIILISDVATKTAFEMSTAGAKKRPVRALIQLHWDTQVADTQLTGFGLGVLWTQSSVLAKVWAKLFNLEGSMPTWRVAQM